VVNTASSIQELTDTTDLNLTSDSPRASRRIEASPTVMAETASDPTQYAM
jgi:hypothetical protein